MASGDDPCPEHPGRTRRNGFRYCFYVAHHGRGSPDDSQWAEDVGREEEFAIFDEADWHDLSDPKGHLYGVRRSPEGEILDLGTKREQIAKFWNPSVNQPAHGFPVWPMGYDVPENRRRTPPPKEAILKMEAAGLLLPERRKKLLKGKEAR